MVRFWFSLRLVILGVEFLFCFVMWCLYYGLVLIFCLYFRSFVCLYLWLRVCGGGFCVGGGGFRMCGFGIVYCECYLEGVRVLFCFLGFGVFWGDLVLVFWLG